MRIRILSLLLFLIYQNSLAQNISDFPEKPTPPRFLVDYTGTLEAYQINQLESTLRQFNDSTSNEIAVVIMRNIGDYDISDYAIQLGHKWGIGKEKKDNGVLLLIALENRKMFIATGQGLEGALPDLVCKRIVDTKIKPYFQKRDYFDGINSGVNEIIKYTQGEYKAEAKQQQSYPLVYLFVILIFIIIGINMFRQNQNGGNNRRGGYRGNTFGPSGGGWYWGGSGGSSWSRGSGGGFGGFGGGSFGGGGAGGDW
jgi:uncharacterized protein